MYPRLQILNTTLDRRE